MEITELTIDQNFPLKELTTFKLGGRAKYYLEAHSIDEVKAGIKFSKNKNLDILVLGYGSNVVISDDGINGLVIKVNITELKIIKDTGDYVYVLAGAGIIWDSFVEYSVSNELWGAENLSLIPGTVGALPVQNVGAYGQDASKIISEVHVIDKLHNEFIILNNTQCQFEWRSSIFNSQAKDRYIITHVVFKLRKYNSPKLSRIDLLNEVKRLSEASKLEVFSEENVRQDTIRQAVINLRTSGKKLPNNGNDYNTGTFFQAVLLKKTDLKKLLPKLVYNYGLTVIIKIIGYRFKYGVGDSFKIPSALLMKDITTKKSENENFKLFENNLAVMIHNGKGTSSELGSFINKIRSEVYKKSGINIPIEPEIFGMNISN